MKTKVLLVILLVLVGVLVAQQATQTPSLGLNKIVVGSTNWGSLVNANFTAIDNYLSGATPIPALVVTGTMTAGKSTAGTFATATNCASSAAPAICGTAAAGMVVVAAASTTVTVNTTAITANSEIFLQEDSSVGSRLSVTCNTTLGRSYVPTSRVAGTSFTVTASAAPTTNPACFHYRLIN